MNLKRIIESVIDPPQPTLSNHVFIEKNGEYTLCTRIRFKILKVWAKVNDVATTGRILIVGSITTFNYSDDSDVDVTIQVLNPAEVSEAQKVAIQYNGVEKAGPHEINYYARQDITYSNYDSVYDVIANKWIQPPREIGVDVDQYMAQFESVVSEIDLDKAELLSDLVDYTRLQQFNGADLSKMQSQATAKLQEIEAEAEKLGDEYLQVKSDRQSAFQEDDLARIREYGSKNALPENVIYLLLRRYCYLNFLHEINGIAQDGVDQSEVGDLANAYTQFNQCEIKKSLNQKLDESFEEFEELDEHPDSDAFEDYMLYEIHGVAWRPKRWDEEYGTDAWKWDFSPDEQINNAVISYQAHCEVKRKNSDPQAPEAVDHGITPGRRYEEMIDGEPYIGYGFWMTFDGYKSKMPQPNTRYDAGEIILIFERLFEV